MVYRFADLRVEKTEYKDGQVELTLKKSDIRKAGLPVDLYYIAMQGNEVINRGLEKSKAMGLTNEQLGQSWEDSKSQHRTKSEVYWQSRQQNNL